MANFLIKVLFVAGCVLSLGPLGCSRRGEETPDDDTVTPLVVWHAYRGDEQRALESVVDQFEERNPGLDIRLVTVPYDAFANKITVAVPRGNGPDLFIFAHDRVGDWASSSLLEPLGFWADDVLVDRFFRNTVDALVYGNELYGLPLAFKTLALYYDRQLVDGAPRTTAELVRASRRVRAQDPSHWGLAYELDSLYFHAPWLHGFGGSVYQGSSDILSLGSEASTQSVEFVRRLVDERICPEEATSALVTALFNQHQLAFVVSGPWFRAELAGHSTWGVAPLPDVSETGLPARPFLGVEGLFMSARSRQKDTAFALMKYLTGDGAASIRFRKAKQLVANTAIYATDEVEKDPFASAFAAQVKNTVPLSNRPHMRLVWTPVKRALSQAITRGRPAREALESAVRVIETKLGRP